MATRDKDPKLTRRQAENARAAIRVGVIIERLQKAAIGELELTPAQIKSAQVLLDKSLPTLQAIESTQVDDKPEMSAEDVDQLLRDMIGDMARQDPASLQALIEEAKARPMLKRVI
jgi:hypothetical protein